MRHAPPVSLRGRGGRGWTALHVALPVLAAAVLVHWAGRHAAGGDVGGTGAPAALAALLAAAAAWRWGRPAAHEVAWDGAVWRVDGTTAAVRVAIDAGGWLLLRWKCLPPPDAGPARRRLSPVPGGWVALTRGEAGGALHALRAALYCPASELSGRPAEPSPPA